MDEWHGFMMQGKRERESDSNGKKMVDKEAEQSMPRDIISRILLSFYSEPAFN